MGNTALHRVRWFSFVLRDDPVGENGSLCHTSAENIEFAHERHEALTGGWYRYTQGGPNILKNTPPSLRTTETSPADPPGTSELVPDWCPREIPPKRRKEVGSRSASHTTA